MVYRIFSAFKRIAAVASIATFRNEPSQATFERAPKPRRRFANAAAPMFEDAWMFDGAASVESRRIALSGEVDRVADALGGLRALLSSIAEMSPTLAPMQIAAASAAPILGDDLLFEGEPLAALAPTPALGDAMFLFEDSVDDRARLTGHRLAA